MLQITDSMFPIGAYTLSNGLETFVAEGYIKTEQDLQEYVKSYMDVLAYGDVGIMLLAYRHAGEHEYLRELDAYANAIKLPSEVRQGSRRLCRRFMKFAGQVEMDRESSLHWYGDELKAGRLAGSYAQAVGLYSYMHGISDTMAAGIYAFSLLTAVVTNAVKLVPLSQVSGQRILFQSDDMIRKCVRTAEHITMDELGISGPQLDIEAMRHEQLYSRLYIS